MKSKGPEYAAQGRGVVLRGVHFAVLGSCIPLHTALKDSFTFFSAIWREEGIFMRKKTRTALFGSLKVMAFAALLSAMSIIFGKLLAIDITPTVRISLGNLPIILSGMLFGPAVGAAVGALSDAVGCLVAGYVMNPLITLGSCATGLVSGAVAVALRKKGLGLRVALSVIMSNLIGSVIIKTLGFYVFYSSPLLITGAWRLVSSTLMGALEGILIYLLLKNGELARLAGSRFVRGGTQRISDTKENKRGETNMTYNEALSYIHSVYWKGSRPGLERISELAQMLGNPQDKLRFVHVAGTNGKGSFCAMTASILSEAGYKVGLFTSPYVLRFNERIRINGEDIPDADLACITEYVKGFADKMSDSPTEFELISAIAFEYFARCGCDIVVLECGMGGRLDSTNIIKNPLLSVITGISLDHTAYLGDTVGKIAYEKAGIIKNGCPVLFCSDNSEALDVIEKRSAECNSPLYLVDRSTFRLISATLYGSEFNYSDCSGLHIPLLGAYQPHNACNAVRAIEILRERGLDIPQKAVYNGLSRVVWHARFELLSKSPVIISDGGHNPEGVHAAIESVRMYFKDERVIFITGVMADKDYIHMVSDMSSVAEHAFCVRPDNPRALSAESLASVFEENGISAQACESVESAVSSACKLATEQNRPVVALGSLYMYEAVFHALNK